ncbi:hypothetical protein Npun_AF174 [Leptolyngbya sp. NIES-3755]|nr:hypothetical protein Npun_AF174 [Leptolyngbya sp. NIES-3755]
MIHLIQQRATPQQIEEMLAGAGLYIKLAVDIKREILAGGGILHADCERVLLENGSVQTNIWGANWYAINASLDYESLINIRPKQGNRSMNIQDPSICDRILEITHRLLGES